MPPNDGLDPVDRAILLALRDLEREFRGRAVPVVTLWGVLIDRGVNLSQDQLNARLTRLGARGDAR